MDSEDDRDRAIHGLVRVRLALKGESYSKRREKYAEQRGMDTYFDMRDWLGGYPYESISPEEAMTFMRGLGFDQLRSFVDAVYRLAGRGV